MIEDAVLNDGDKTIFMEEHEVREFITYMLANPYKPVCSHPNKLRVVRNCQEVCLQCGEILTDILAEKGKYD